MHIAFGIFQFAKSHSLFVAFVRPSNMYSCWAACRIVECPHFTPASNHLAKKKENDDDDNNTTSFFTSLCYSYDSLLLSNRVCPREFFRLKKKWWNSRNVHPVFMVLLVHPHLVEFTTQRFLSDIRVSKVFISVRWALLNVSQVEIMTWQISRILLSSKISKKKPV